MCLNVYNCVCYLLLPFYFLGKFFELFLNLFGIQKTFPGQNVVFMMTESKPTIAQCAGFVSLLNECDRTALDSVQNAQRAGLLWRTCSTKPLQFVHKIS